jgi:putative colanic acid biosynthesis UDP-glucose lipid carrier transferase
MHAAALLAMGRKTSPLDLANPIAGIEKFLDATALIGTLGLVSWHFEGALLPNYWLLAILLFALSYPGLSRLHASVGNLLLGIILNWSWIVALLFLLGLAGHYLGDFSTAALLTCLWLTPLVQLAAHLGLRLAAPWLMTLQGTARRVVIVGHNEQAMALAKGIAENRYAGLELHGIFDDRENQRCEDTTASLLRLGTLGELATYVKAHHIQFIYLSLPMSAQPRILQVLNELKDTTASIYFVPDMFVTDLIQGSASTVCGIPVIAICESPFTGSNGLIKRLSDFILALLILGLISPFLLLIALAVKLSSPGPVIFKQRRYGLDGEEILVYKFRSMSVCEDGGTVRQAEKNDARVTRLGGFLRKTSLDELPQFINVLQGRMSIVGPRPHAVAHNELYRTLIMGYMIRHKVKPGITGWAQINGYRGETDTLDKMQGRIDYDLDYLRHWSLTLDLQIILKTVQVVFKDRAAY